MRKKDTCTHACRLGEVTKLIIADGKLVVNKNNNNKLTN